MSPEEREQKVSELIIKACGIARESEREACAKLAEELGSGAPNLLIATVCRDIAAAIRARGGK